MGWLTDIKNLLPLNLDIKLGSTRRNIVLMHKVNTFDLEVCKAKGILRDQPWWRMERLDYYHLFPDGSIEHTPGN